ncbi:hypothetical protein IWX65_002260 [Arthrobacter sp. CAN_A214]|uniref:hypothetical protein n=1 Tax=Arthrobacter sp. CAN_A214 TaxID=2787720 RepID=UPI0018CA45B9
MDKKDEGQEPVARHHNEAPAEGDRTADPSDTGVHAQDPAEGPDTGDTVPDE